MGDVILSGKITALEPLHLGTGILIGTYQPTLDHIPARAIRGMLGNYLFSHDKELYNDLGFKNGDEKIYFKPGLPENSVYAPALFKVCKGCGKIQKIRFDSECLSDNECECGHDTKELRGLIKKDWTTGKKVERPKIKKQINTKCPIVKEWHTTYPKEGEKSPYNVEAICRGTKFDFRVVVEEKYSQRIKEALIEAGIFYGVGGLRSRGYGAVLFEFLKEEMAETHMERRGNGLKSELCLMVVNSPVILRAHENTVVELGEKFKDAAQETGRKHGLKPEKIVRAGSLMRVRGELLRGWSIEKGNRLDEFYYGIAPGSCATYEISPRLVACLEVYGVGYLNNIYGDVYFLDEIEKYVEGPIAEVEK